MSLPVLQQAKPRMRELYCPNGGELSHELSRMDSPTGCSPGKEHSKHDVDGHSLILKTFPKTNSG